MTVKKSVSKATHSIGLDTKTVIILSVDEVNQIALCRDRVGGKCSVPTNVLPGKSYIPPQQGETWLIDRSAGKWSFAKIINYTAPGPVVFASRNQIVLTSATPLANNSSTQRLAIISHNSYRLMAITTNIVMRIRVYDTVAHQAADVSRAYSSPPTAGSGVFLDYENSTPTLSATLLPMVDGADMSMVPAGNVPITVTNISGASSNYTVTITYLGTEPI